MVRISPLLCFFCLFLASAASECGGQENCVGEKDAAVLLQGPIRMHDQGSALSQTSNLGELDQEEDQDVEEAAGATYFEEKEGEMTDKSGFVKLGTHVQQMLEEEEEKEEDVKQPIYQIKAKHGVCLDASQRSNNGGKVHMWACDTNNKNQQWTYSASTGQIKASYGVCLDASERSKNGGKVHMWACNTNNQNQQWTYSASTGQIKARHGLCLDASQRSANGGTMHMWSCDTNNKNQQWTASQAATATTATTTGSCKAHNHDTTAGCDAECAASRTRTACGNAGSNCELIGGTCMASCATFTQATCPLDFCYLRSKMIVHSTYTTYASTKSCLSYASSMVFGGIPSQATKNHMVREGKIVSRPEYMTAQHLSATETEWKACGGTTNCWSVTGERYIKGYLTSGFKSLAVEFAITCNIEGGISVVKLQNKEKNAEVKVWYNLKPQTVGWRGPNRWNHQEYYLTPSIGVKESDEEPVLRIELSRLAAGQDAAWEARVDVGPVQRPFDACMDVKGTHGQCLKVFAGANSELRFDHQMQLDCIDGKSKGSWSDKKLCETWLACLKKDSQDAIATIRVAINAAAGLNFMQVEQNRTDVIPGSSGVCLNPATLDIESFDCNCFDWMQGKSQQDIRCAFCTFDKVCSAWANVNCNNCPTALVETASEEITMSQQNLGQKDSEDMATASLDESLSGKRC